MPKSEGGGGSRDRSGFAPWRLSLRARVTSHLAAVCALDIKPSLPGLSPCRLNHNSQLDGKQPRSILVACMTSNWQLGFNSSGFRSILTARVTGRPVLLRWA